MNGLESFAYLVWGRNFSKTHLATDSLKMFWDLESQRRVLDFGRETKSFVDLEYERDGEFGLPGVVCPDEVRKTGRTSTLI